MNRTGAVNRWIAVLVAALASSSCATDPNATLALTADPVVAVTTASVLELGGTVVRTPLKLVAVFVEASGGVGVPVDTTMGERFSVLVTLNPAAVNTITLRATDASGAVAASVVVTVRQQPAAGTFTLTPDPTGPLASEADLVVTGTVTRVPALTTPIFVRAAGGVESTTDTVTDGQFSVVVTLHPNVSNTITLTATDDLGSASSAPPFTILHDGIAPTIVQATPADTSDGITAGTLLRVTLSEPLAVFMDGGIQLSRQGLAVAGATTMSADSLTLSFVPSVALSPNAIYRMAFVGVSDRAGNAISFGTSSCFVTSPIGAAATFTAADSSNDLYRSLTPPIIAAPDLIAARFAREGALFSGVFRFAGPRSFERDGVDRAEIFVDLDTDQDSTTGFVTLKDTLFLNSGPPLDTLGSGTRAEYIIGLSPLASAGDNAYVGKYTAPLNFQVVDTFQPGVCGSFMSFAIPFTLVDDDGKLNAVVMGYSGSGNSILVDPMPAKGRLELDLGPLTPAPVLRTVASGAPLRAQPLATLPRKLPVLRTREP